jgi:hypothetical protein
VQWTKNLNLDVLGGRVHGRQQPSLETSTTWVRASTRLSSARNSAHQELCTEELCGCAAHLYANQSQIEVGMGKGAHPTASNKSVSIL